VLVSSVAKGDELLRIGANEVVTEVSQLSSPVYGVIENIGAQTLVDTSNHLAPRGALVSVGGVVKRLDLDVRRPRSFGAKINPVKILCH
jgi:hypothetical protein